MFCAKGRWQERVWLGLLGVARCAMLLVMAVWGRLGPLCRVLEGAWGALALWCTMLYYTMP